MFFGTVPNACISQVFKTVDFGSWGEVYVCCSGSFRIERALLARWPKLVVHSNDVSLYSTALGRLARGEDVDLHFVGPLEFLEPLTRACALDRVAGVLIACELSRYGAGKPNAYKTRHFNHYVENIATFMDKARAKLAETVQAMPIASYSACDWRTHVDNAIAAGKGIAAFPPFFKGDYEAQFRFVHDNIEWEAPSYDLYDPKELGSIVDKIADAGVPYVVLTDQTLEGRAPVMEYVQGRKVPHFCYSSSERSSYRNIHPERPSFHYKAVDLAKLSPKTKVRVVLADNKQADYLKDVYLSKNIIHTPGMANFFVYLDDMLVGALVYSLQKYVGTYGPGAIYLLSDVTTTREAKLSKLVAYLAGSDVILRELDKKFIRRFDMVTTTARTHNPVSMKYRGIYELLTRRPADNPEEGNILQYGLKRHTLTPQQVYEWWFTRYGQSELGKALRRSPADGAQEPASAGKERPVHDRGAVHASGRQRSGRR